jgi:hypothetical protein
MAHFVFSYLDPGTGSMLVQSIIGGIAGIAYLGRKQFSRLVTALRKKRSSDK